MKTNSKQPFGLINVLLDKNARIDERDDAAMDLSIYDNEIVENALINVIFEPLIDDIILDSASESLSIIWKRNKIYKKEIVNKMPKIAYLHFKDYSESCI